MRLFAAQRLDLVQHDHGRSVASAWVGPFDLTGTCVRLERMPQAEYPSAVGGRRSADRRRSGREGHSLREDVRQRTERLTDAASGESLAVDLQRGREWPREDATIRAALKPSQAPPWRGAGIRGTRRTPRGRRLQRIRDSAGSAHRMARSSAPTTRRLDRRGRHLSAARRRRSERLSRRSGRWG